MKNSPAKDQGDILRHVYTPKVNLEDGVFEDVEGSKKMEAIKQFQKRTDEGICGAYVESVRTLVMNGRLVDDCTRLWHMPGDFKTYEMEIGIKNTLKFTESVQNKVDEMLEIASITYPDNEEFKRIAEYRNERIMKAFKPGKVTEMLNIKNAIESVEPLNQEEEPNYDNIQSTDELIETQPERTPPTELETVRETPKNELEANLDENVGGDGNENEIQNIWLNSVSLEKVNVITEENLESNLVNSKKGDNCDVDIGKSMDEGKETNLDGVLKEGDNDISKRDKENTFNQILTKMKNKKQQTMGNTSIIIGGYEQVTHGLQKDKLSRVVDIAVADTLQEKSMTVGRKESPVTRSMDA
ncbi:hypothetical protein Tco_0955204 [Tanacetum coccineum]|uniref:Uncharacterized protein n=1 Tax=Tanacetum coccineum TaxID=301880 RepID=A0ABQ5E6I5_9ASTR